jgi:protein TonB
VRQAQPSLDVAALKAFGEILAQAIGKRKDYPRLARLRNWQGTTELKLQIGPDGKLLDVHVGHSSGFQVLDAAAIQMVQNAAPLPDVPEALRGRELTMTVPVVFKLETL